MPTMEAPAKPRKHRRVDSVVVNVTFDREAVTLLKQLCPPGRKGTGRLLGRLLYEHAARLEERAKVKQTLYAALKDDGDSLVK